MRRVLVIGSGGAGKSTFSRRLGQRLGLPVVHLDAHYWRAGWVEPAREEWTLAVARLLEREHWVIDGNYSGTLPARLAACDTVVFLDLPRWLCLWRVCWRALSHRGRTRPDMADGCPERLEPAFLRWVWDYRRRSRPAVLALLAEAGRQRKVVHLGSRREVERFLRSLHEGTR
ncbi:topology modulation protein [Pseudomonas sp. GCM10022186]|uniref:topology modulation protein n=1 Tax=Pseudomonas sp. GCM10022186 TaxID=3252650 RepID=UPI003606FFE9